MASLGHDLASIRKHLDLSIDDVQFNTKLPPKILESIEDDSIFSNLNNNKTYVRSYVRSYARALKIDDENIIQALDEVETGRYAGGLLKRDERIKSGQEKQEAAQKDESSEKDEKKEKESSDNASKTPKEVPAPPAKRTSPKRIKQKPDIQSVDWSEFTHKSTATGKKTPLWIGLVILLIIIVAIALFFTKNHQNSKPKSAASSSSSAMTQPRQPSDSLKKSLANSAGQQVLADSTVSTTSQPTLPDTLTIEIYAVHGKLNPIHVYTDLTKKENPYWINQGNALQVHFHQTLRLRAINKYDRMVLLFRGHLINDYFQQFYNTKTHRIELNRSDLEQHPSWQKSRPDSLLNAVPPPKKIIRK